MNELTQSLPTGSRMRDMVETRLKAVLRERHWTYSAFCREYDRIASSTVPDLVGTAPSRAQLHRWLTGQLKGLPFPDHCRMLEKMFPGWTVTQLFTPVNAADVDAGPMIDRLIHAMSPTFTAKAAACAGWGRCARRRYAEPAENPPPNVNTAVAVAKRLATIARVLRLDSDETLQIAGLAGNVVELSQTIDVGIDIDGSVRVAYRHQLFNMSHLPIARWTRKLWFEQTSGTLDIAASDSVRRSSIERIHDVGNVVTFACLFSPAIYSGEIVTVEYHCTGGEFGKDLFWRQDIAHYTRQLTLTVHQKGVRELSKCSVIEEYCDGTQSSATDDLHSDIDGDSAMITLTRDYLHPGQALTLRWECA